MVITTRLLTILTQDIQICNQYHASINPSLLQIGATIALPLFNHAGSSYEYPVPCDCSTLTDEDKADEDHPCNDFVFFLGMLYFDSLDPTPIANLVASISYDEILYRSFYALYLGSNFGQFSPYNLSPYRDGIYDFCTSDEYGACRYIWFSLFDTNKDDWSVTPYRYQLKTGACQDTFSLSTEATATLLETPYSPLH